MTTLHFDHGIGDAGDPAGSLRRPALGLIVPENETAPAQRSLPTGPGKHRCLASARRRPVDLVVLIAVVCMCLYAITKAVFHAARNPRRHHSVGGILPLTTDLGTRR